MRLSSEKSAARIYFNNFIAYSIFSGFKQLLGDRTVFPMNNIIFINSGQIGDLMVSSILFENEYFLPDEFKYHFIYKDTFAELFADYKGKFNLIPYSHAKYKFNAVYKYKFLKKLHELKALRCYNLTAARGILNDEMALLSGAKDIFCTDNSWLYLKKLFGKRMDKNYDKVLFEKVQNEYDKHLKLLRKWFDVKPYQLQIKNRYTFVRHSEVTTQLPAGYMTLAPFSSITEKSWPLWKFRELTERFPEKKFILLGSKSQYKLCHKEFAGSKNVMNCCGKFKLNEVASVIYDSAFHVGNDSGLTHVALKLGVPFASIIGGYNFNKFFPFEYEGMKGKYFYVPLECFGCEWNCKYDRAKCLTDVEVNDVYHYIRQKLDGEIAA